MDHDPERESLPEAAPNDLLPVQGGGRFAKHWRGDYSLARSWWQNGVLIFGFGINLVGFTVLLVALNALQSQPVLVIIVGLGEIALLIAAYVWAFVGTWRAAGKYKGSRFWPILARVLMCIGVLETVSNTLITINTIVHVAEARSAEGIHYGR